MCIRAHNYALEMVKPVYSNLAFKWKILAMRCCMEAWEIDTATGKGYTMVIRTPRIVKTLSDLNLIDKNSELDW